ncbi:hypothetical protein OKW45_002177 [Paraburkholderia sp. WSM4175]|uniref:hypothetical protein n=1 Tax=Paraburkholderia sp. WSM4175 TaxID=2991072 RepID=UPI003D1F2FAE
MAPQLIVEQNANKPNRVDCLWPGTLIDQLPLLPCSRNSGFDIAFVPVFAALAHRCGKYSHGLRNGYLHQEFSARGKREQFQRFTA